MTDATPATPRRASRRRRGLALVALFLACLTILLSTIAVWTHQIAAGHRPVHRPGHRRRGRSCDHRARQRTGEHPGRRGPGYPGARSPRPCPAPPRCWLRRSRTPSAKPSITAPGRAGGSARATGHAHHRLDGPSPAGRPAARPDHGPQDRRRICLHERVPDRGSGPRRTPDDGVHPARR